MNLCPSREVLVKFLAGHASVSQEELVRNHIAECSTCQTLSDELTDDAEVRQLFRSHRESSLENAVTDVIARLREMHSNDDQGMASGEPDASLGAGWQLAGQWVDRTLPVTLGRYRLLERLGAGGFGIVYRAHDTQLNRSVALKLPRSNALLEPQGRIRFLREAKAAAALHHPHIVAVYDVGECDGICYLASAYCPGNTLAQWLASRDRPAEPDEAAEIVLALADAVQHAHESGVLHRDLKPQNVLLDPTAKFRSLPFAPKLTDFGVAKIVDDEGNETVTDLVLGTSRYIAPELAAGRREQLGPACDIYALGVVLYELLTRRAPIDGSSHADTLRRVLTDEPIPLRKLAPAVPRDLEAICLNCLEKSPGHRYSTASNLAQDLDRYLHRQPTVVRPIAAYERVYRWIRRRPAAAALLAVSITASLFALVGLTLYNTRLGALNLDLHRTNVKLESALVESERAQARAKSSETRAQQLLYVSDMRLAGRAWKEGDMRALTNLLSRHIPTDDSPDRRGLEWHFLWSQCAAPSRVIDQGNEAIYCLLASHDGKWFATAGKDAIVRIYDMTTGDLETSIATGQGEVNGVDFSPDGQALVSAGDDGTVRVWSLPDGQQTMSVAAHTKLAFGAIFIRGGDSIVTCGNEATMNVWDRKTANLLRTLPGHTQDQAEFYASRVDAVVLSPDGHLLASVGGDGTARIWELDTFEEIHKLHGGDDLMAASAFSNDGTRLVTAGFDHTIRLWDVASGRQLAIGKHLDKCRSVHLTADGQFIVSGDNAGVIQFWRVPAAASGANDSPSDPIAELTLLRRWPAHDGRVFSVRFSPDGKRLLTAGADGFLKSWSVPSVAGPRVVRLGSEPLVDLIFVSNSKNIALAFEDRIRLWDPESGDMVKELAGAHETWRYLGTDWREELLCACQFDGEFGVWDLARGTKRQSWNLGGDTGNRAICLSPDGSMSAVFAGPDEDAVYLFDVASGRLIDSLIVPLSMLMTISFHPAGDRLAIVDDRNIIVWNWSTGERRAIDSAHAGTIHCHAFDRSGSLLATASTDRFIKLWDPITGDHVRTLSGHRSAIKSIAFSPDGRSLVSGDMEGCIKVWNVALGEELFDLHFGSAPILRLRVSGDGRQVACLTREDDLLLFSFPDLGNALPDALP
jgi:WD40 repeat protein